MAQLPSRTVADTRASHASDHNELHDTHNTIDPDAASEGDMLVLTSGEWLADTPANHGISETSHNHAGVYDEPGHTHTESDITDFSGETETTTIYSSSVTAYNALTTDRVILIDTAAAAVIVTLPLVTAFGNYSILIKRTGANPVTIQRTVADSIWTDGATAFTKLLDSDGAHWSAITKQSGMWITIGEHGTVT